MSRGTINSGSLVEDIDHAPAAGRARARPNDPNRAQRFKIAFSIAALLVALCLLAWQTLGGGPSAAEESVRRTVVDSQTGEVFIDFRIPKTGMYPWKNPKTGTDTLWPAEKCFWTKDGKAKIEPTYVLLNRFAGKPGDTICPDCGRKIVPHNPMPPMSLMNEALGITEQDAPPPP
ncbi:MAG: hypothetical protein AB7K52_07395 [Phycisphaerales bacterium]